MAQPLHSDFVQPQEKSFSHFGVLNDGKRSKSATITSITINVVIALLVIVLGMVVKTNSVVARKLTELALPPSPPKVEQPKPPPPPPPVKLPPPPKMEAPKVEPPKIKLPEPEIKPEIKPIEVPVPKPVVAAPAPPKIAPPAPAPKVVTINNMAAAVANNDAHPTAVRLGQADSAIKPTGPAVAAVNLGNAGMAGMPAGNTGNGPHATHVNLGSGSPNGSDLNASGRAVAGVKLGCTGCNGPLNSTNYSNAPKQVQLQAQAAPPPVHQAEVRQAVLSSPPVVKYKPTPAYTEEAKSMHVEGAVSIRIKVLSSGSVQVLTVTRGLGHGLDQSAIQAIEATRFSPAKDSAGQAVDWEGVVNVNFQLS